MKLLPFNTSWWADSNDISFIFLWLLDGKILQITFILHKNSLLLYNGYITVIYVI